jgi:prolipoprotein diacylglyceryl transferase
MPSHALAQGQYIPSPPVSGLHIGPAFIHFYGLMYVIGIALAIYITRRRAAAAGGDPALVSDVALWVVPAGIIGGRIYFDLTTPFDIVPRHVWWGPLAVWNGGLGIWGGVAAGALVGVWRVRRAGQKVGLFLDAVAPALLVAQAVGRIGNYFNPPRWSGWATTARSGRRACSRSTWPATPGTGSSRRPYGSTPRPTPSACG